MFYRQFQKAAMLLLLVAMCGCAQMREPNQTLVLNASELERFSTIVGYMQFRNYVGAYRELLVVQNSTHPANQAVLVALFEIRKIVARKAFESSMVSLRRYYYQANQWSAQNAANDANFICEMEGFEKPKFLVDMNRRLKQDNQELYLILTPRAEKNLEV